MRIPFLLASVFVVVWRGHMLLAVLNWEQKERPTSTEKEEVGNSIRKKYD